MRAPNLLIWSQTRCRCALAPLACRAPQQATQLATALGTKARERKEKFDSAPPRQTQKPKTARGASGILPKRALYQLR